MKQLYARRQAGCLRDSASAIATAPQFVRKRDSYLGSAKALSVSARKIAMEAAAEEAVMEEIQVRAPRNRAAVTSPCCKQQIIGQLLVPQPIILVLSTSRSTLRSAHV